MSANDKQVGGTHYQTGDVQHWDWAKDLPYLEGRATAYLGRHRDKNGLQDVEKSLHFIQKIVETCYPGYVMDFSIREARVDPGRGDRVEVRVVELPIEDVQYGPGPALRSMLTDILPDEVIQQVMKDIFGEDGTDQEESAKTEGYKGEPGQP